MKTLLLALGTFLLLWGIVWTVLGGWWRSWLKRKIEELDTAIHQVFNEVKMTSINNCQCALMDSKNRRPFGPVCAAFGLIVLFGYFFIQ